MSGEPLVLASASPRRRAILEQLGIAFEVDAPCIAEQARGEPDGLVRANAVAKARAVAASRPGRTVLGADTVVAVDGRPLGKPVDRSEAREFLGLLSGREHTVFSGIAVLDAAGERTGVASTRVRLRPLEREVMDWYLATGEWEDKAGGYAIQGRGAALVDAIEGDYFTVVGLPVAALCGLAPELLW